MDKILPTLYRQASSGKIMQWTIRSNGNTVTTVYGQHGGKLQSTTDIVKEGKNLGKANATTVESQAQAQAQQNWDGKIKEGYVESLSLAKSTKNTLGAIKPMCAHDIQKKPKAVMFPARAQPKLDGLRCTAIVHNGDVKLYSRSQKEILTVPHIVEEIEKLYAGKSIILDGELYSHEFKDDFNAITSLAKRDDVHEESTKIQYHLYDVAAPGNHEERTSALLAGKFLMLVETVVVQNMAELEAFQLKCIAQGYEGCMYRNPSGEYEYKRSNYLLKVKTFQDDEFKIVDVEEGGGKLMGAVGAFILVTKDGTKFGAKPRGSLARSQEFWKNRKSMIGKWGTVKFQNYTPDGVPRFPVFKAIRDE